MVAKVALILAIWTGVAVYAMAHVQSMPFLVTLNHILGK